MDNDEKREIREIIAQKNMSDETLQNVIWNCAINEWVEELRLCVNVPRSSVEYLLYIDVCCLNYVKYCCEYFWFLFLCCTKINKIVV